MALAIALDQAKGNTRHFKHEKGVAEGQGFGTKFFDFPDQPLLPHASLNRHDKGYFNGTHYHVVDQFQVVIEGSGTLGRHALAQYGVHFTRAYTPYGPLVSEDAKGLTFFALRAHRDRGPQRIPQEIDQLKKVANRKPWQTTCQAKFPDQQLQAASQGCTLQPIVNMVNDQGLSAYALTMKPDAVTTAPDPSQGDGQYLVLVNGSLWLGDKEYKSMALVFVSPEEGRLQLRAGSEGLEALVLNFPRPLYKHYSQQAA